MARLSADEESSAGPVLRLLRAALLASATLGVAVWAHRSADGNLPGPAAVAAIWVAAVAIAAAFLGRPASYAKVICILACGQAGLHVVLSLTAGHGARPAVSAAARHYATTSMLAERHVPSPHEPGASALTDALGTLVGELASAQGLAMTGAHLGAAVLVGIWLATGERLLWVALRRVAAATRAGVGALCRLVLTLVPTTTPSVAPHFSWPELHPDRRRVDWLSATSRRGPPAPPLVLAIPLR